MDLLTAAIQRPTIIDVRRELSIYTVYIAGDRRGRQGARRHGASERRGADRADERAALRREACPEGGRYGAGVRVLDGHDSRIPCLEAIDGSGLDCPARMVATRFAPVFNIDAEDKPAIRCVLAA